MTNLEFMYKIKEKAEKADREGYIPVYDTHEKLLLILAEEIIKQNEQLYNVKRTLESIELMIRQMK